MRGRRHLAALTLVVALASLAVPQADVCAMDGAARHDCCAPPATAPGPPAEPCCSSVPSAPPPSAATGETDRAECDCIHAPAVPEAATVGTPTLSGDESSALPGSDTSVTHASPVRGALASDHGHRFTGEPPPLYLMECAFLI